MEKFKERDEMSTVTAGEAREVAFDVSKREGKGRDRGKTKAKKAMERRGRPPFICLTREGAQSQNTIKVTTWIPTDEPP